jgi:hypothetical protein
MLSQGLDEVQAYILLRRWQTDHADTILGSRLSNEQQQGLAQAYLLERLCSLESLRLILQICEGLPWWHVIEAVNEQSTAGQPQ